MFAVEKKSKEKINDSCVILSSNDIMAAQIFLYLVRKKQHKKSEMKKHEKNVLKNILSFS